MKKLFILPLLMLLCLIPMLPAQAASKAEITSVRTATRNDANVPFVRTVLELDSKVTPRLFIDKDGKEPSAPGAFGERYAMKRYVWACRYPLSFDRVIGVIVADYREIAYRHAVLHRFVSYAALRVGCYQGAGRIAIRPLAIAI